MDWKRQEEEKSVAVTFGQESVRQALGWPKVRENSALADKFQWASRHRSGYAPYFFFFAMRLT